MYLRAGEDLADAVLEGSFAWNAACDRWVGCDFERACEEPCCEDQWGALLGLAQVLDAFWPAALA